MNNQYQIISIEEIERLSDPSNRLQYNGNNNPQIIDFREFNEDFTIKKYFNIPSGYSLSIIKFTNCIFNKNVIISDRDEAGYVEFHNCIFNGSVKIQSNNSTYDPKCVFNNDLSIYAKGGLEISKLNVKGNLNVIVKEGSLTMDHINEDIKVENQIILIGSTNDIIINKLFSKNLRFTQSSYFKNKFKLNDVQVEQIDMDSLFINVEMEITNSVIKTLSINKILGDSKKLSITETKIDEFNFDISQLKNTSIKKCSVRTLRINNANEPESIINIEGSPITNLELNNVYNKGLMVFRNLEIPPGGIVAFNNSNIGKADFIYCDFSNAKFEFENSKITEAFYSETKFPKQVYTNNQINYSQAQLAFGQLANAFQKQGDSIRFLEYTSREVEAHYRSLSFISKDLFHKINLFLNFISNNFGRDWILGVVFSIIVGVLFFSLLLISTDLYELGSPTFEANMIPAYLKFMNPLRFFELESVFVNTQFEGKVILKPSSYFADLGGRIFVTYGYYQTIQAFRKFGKK